MARTVPIPIGPIYAGGPCRGLVHVIQKGDTLYRLGKQYHVSVTQLMFANPFVDVYNLQIGDELCIPAAIQPRQAGNMQESLSGGMGAGEPGQGKRQEATSPPMEMWDMGAGEPSQGMRQETPSPSVEMWDTEPSGGMGEEQESHYLRFPIEREPAMPGSFSGGTEIE